MVTACEIAEGMRISQGDKLIPVLALKVLCPQEVPILDTLQGSV